MARFCEKIIMLLAASKHSVTALSMLIPSLKKACGPIFKGSNLKPYCFLQLVFLNFIKYSVLINIIRITKLIN